MSHNKSSPDFLYHHFYDVNQQYETSKLGMWGFILTEVLTFGALFVAYTVYRAWNPDMFINANLLLDVNKGLMNTIVLIGSSLTMALAIWAMAYLSALFSSICFPRIDLIIHFLINFSKFTSLQIKMAINTPLTSSKLF